MKVSSKSVALVAVLLSTALVQARRTQTWPKPETKMNPTGRVQCVKEESATRGCPCNKPKPKPGPRAQVMQKGCVASPEMRGCPCAKPKPSTPSRDQQVTSFRSASVAQQRKQLADQVAAYVSNPSMDAADMLTSCAAVFCERVNNQTMNKLVKELVMATNKKAVQTKIMRTLEV